MAKRKPHNKTEIDMPAADMPAADMPAADMPAADEEVDSSIENALRIVTEADDDLGGVEDTQESAAVDEAQPALRRGQAAPVANAEMDRIVGVVATADLRVVVADTNVVLLLEKDVERQLPYRLAMAAQISGGTSGVGVTISQ